MITEIVALFAFLFENCTGVVIIYNYAESSEQNSLLDSGSKRQLEDFTAFDSDDTIFREFDPPPEQEDDPKAWKQSLPSLKTSFFQCLKSVLQIQTVAGTLIGLLAVFWIFLDLNSVELCYDYQRKRGWNNMTLLTIERIRTGSEAVEGFFIELWHFMTLLNVFPWSLIKELNLLPYNLLGALIDTIYRLLLYFFGIHHTTWMTYPLNALSFGIILANSYILGRHFSPSRLKTTLKTGFVLSVQFVIGFPIAWLIVDMFLPWYIRQEALIKLVVAGFLPLLTAIPKVVARLAAQNLKMIHPGAGHVLVAILYGASAIVLRIMQSELSALSLFVVLGIGHAMIDFLERITVTMRDEIWEYLYYRLLRRHIQRKPLKYRSPRSRRFMADVSIQMMLQESSGLVAALGFSYTYRLMFEGKPYSDRTPVYDFLIRSVIGLSIDLFFNTISLLIQTRVMNVAVNRVWRKKWKHHVLVNAIVSSLAVLYFTEYLFNVTTAAESALNMRGFDLNCTNPHHY